MSVILPAFLDELEKCGVAGKLMGWKGRALLGGGLTAAFTGMAAADAYKKGRRGDQKPRYLHAGVDPVSGQAMASRAAYTNYNKLFPGKPSKKDLKRLHGKYKEKAFRR